MQNNELELFKACQILFGGKLDVSKEFLEYIQWSGLKSAYRKKVRETHPDGVAREGKLVQRRKANEFRTVQEAYENLTNYLTARDRKVGSGVNSQHVKARRKTRGDDISGIKSKPSARHRRKNGKRPFGGFSTSSRPSNGVADARPKPSSTSALYKGALPKRQLLFGHFLYYSGLINWRTIVKALAWQKNNRPRIGELGKRVGWLTGADIEKIIRHRKGMESFGHSAVQHRYLSSKQLQSLIVQQKRLQRKFGDFFIAHKIFSLDQMEHLAKECHRHNCQFPG